MESMLAVIALIAVASLAKGEAAAQGLTTLASDFARSDCELPVSHRTATLSCVYAD